MPSLFADAFDVREIFVASTGELLLWSKVVAGYGVRPTSNKI